jgi:NADH:ubiquinone oxidoreductase subunit K
MVCCHTQERKQEKLNIQYISIFSFIIFLMGLCGAVLSRKFLNILISLQFFIISALINFLGFSLFVYDLSYWDKSYVFFAIISIYLFLFMIVFYNYSKQTNIYWLDAMADMALFKPDKSDWWGDEKDDSA